MYLGGGGGGSASCRQCIAGFSIICGGDVGFKSEEGVLSGLCFVCVCTSLRGSGGAKATGICGLRRHINIGISSSRVMRMQQGLGFRVQYVR